MESEVKIREASRADLEGIWPIFEEVIRAGETYPYPMETCRADCLHYWFDVTDKAYVAELAGRIVGTYHIMANKPGLGGHVCNCGYMVAADMRGLGIGRKLGEHSLAAAVELGYKAMQFNLVVATNEASMSLWPKLGFEIVGRLPGAFKHAGKGYVDAYVMYKILEG